MTGPFDRLFGNTAFDLNRDCKIDAGVDPDDFDDEF